jgi:LCP family protein required for cell wall assembly
MSQKIRRIPVSSSVDAKRPTQDALTAQRQAGRFPSVGMTLHSYKYDPRDYHGRPSAAAAVVRPGWFKRLRRRFTLKRFVLTFVSIIALLGLWVGGTFVYNAHKLFGGNIFGVLHTTHLKGENVGRVNILLAGNSADDTGHSGGQLTDSIMILSIDTKNNKAFMLSIPRDLWVGIGNDGHQKINAAYVYGQENEFDVAGYPKGGMGQLEQVVEEDFGIPIDYYALVNYTAFRDTVNAVGGIDITINSDNPYGIYDPSVADGTRNQPLVKLSNGTHHLNGIQALNLARARGDAYGSYGFAGSDFDRTMHQRQMLVALKSKVVSAGVITNPAKLTSLSNAIGNNVKTDMNLSEFRRLYDLTKPITGSALQSLSLNDVNGKNLLMSYAGPGGQSALAPAAGLDDFDDIQAFLKQKMSHSPIVQENASVVLLNGTTTTGLASKEKSLLRAKDVNVDDIGDAQTSQKVTVIIDNSKGKKPSTKKLLQQLYGNHVNTKNPYAGEYTADFIIVLGNDRASTSVSAQ